MHEGAYDFTRFTVLGHRFLFKYFDCIQLGGNEGVGVALTWSIRYFLWSLLRSKKIAMVVSIPLGIFFRFIERFADKRSLYDGSSGVFFLGRKSNKKISHKDLVRLYSGLQ